MNFTALRNGTALAVAILGISGFMGQAQAQTVITTNLTVDSAITVTPGNNIEFGTWLLIYRNGDAFELVMDTAGVVTPTNLTGVPGDSVAIQLAAGTGQGTLTVDLPVGANGVLLNMTRGAITDMPDLGLTLQTPTYGTFTQGANQAFPQATNVPVTVITGGAPETVSFGATVAVTAQPANAAHAGTFTVNFAY